MGRVSLSSISSSSFQSIPPFLKKLVSLTDTAPLDVSKWSDDGGTYIIINDLKFSDLLKLHFKGTQQTFIRQLHFYGFRKIDVFIEDFGGSGGSKGKVKCWGFQHEEGFFVRDDLSLVKEIRRKTKVDPETQKLASYEEMQALKCQVNFLQETIEHLRTKLDTVSTLVDSPSVSADVIRSKLMKASLSNDNTEGQLADNRRKISKRQKRSSISEISSADSAQFDEMISKISPPFTRKGSFETGSQKSLTSLMSIDDFSELFSDLDIAEMNEIFDSNETSHIQAPTIEPSPIKLEMEDECQNVYVKRISEATKVDEKDVGKVLTYLANLNNFQGLTISDSTNKTQRKVEFVGACNKDYKMEPIIQPMRIQKVAAN